jgi:predicted transcriptional regulator
MLENFWSKLKRYKSLGALALGPLEKKVMEHIWVSGGCSVRELHTEFSENLAYTTLMTTLDRLHKKGLLRRTLDGKAFRYAPALTRDELDHKLAQELIGAIVRDRQSSLPVLSCFVDAISVEDEDLLSSLENEIKKRRAAMKKRAE